MTEKNQVIFYAIVIIGVVSTVTFFSTQVVATAAAASDPCSSVEGLYKNRNQCDGQNVTLTGKVCDIEFSTSEKGNKYTTFLLDDATAVPINVFSYSHLLISEGDRVSVRGTFHKVVARGNHTFPMELVTTPEDVSAVTPVVTPAATTRFPLLLMPVIIGVSVIAVIFVLLSKRSKKTSKSKDPDANYERGAAFEDCVQSLFDVPDWRIERATSDLGRKYKRSVKSDSDPDFVMRHRQSNKVVAVECKYRSIWKSGKAGKMGITWASDYKIKNYKVFHEKEHVPVFIAIGVGGTPSKPDHLFLVPLYRLKYRFAFREYLDEFERSPEDKFTIDEFKRLDKAVYDQ